MNWLDQAISWVAPGVALDRVRARRSLKVLNEYEAANPSRLRKALNDARSANAQNERSAEALRKMARSLEQNLDIAKGALDVLVANVIGTGIVPEPQIELENGEPAEDINRELLRLWDDWIYSPEVTRQFDFYTLQRMVARSWLRDGEVFAQKLTGRVAGLDHNTLVPFSIEALEADFVPYSLSDPTKPNLVQGIELDNWGRPKIYIVYKGHPGDAGTRLTTAETKRITADRMLHLKMVSRLHQLRGVSVFHSVIARLDDIKEIDESERVAARVASAMAAYIKKGTPDAYSPPLDAMGNTVAVRSMEMAPGMIFDDLLPGEEIGTIDTKRPNNALIPFRDAQLRSASAGLGAGFSSISKNYNGTYSAQRQELVEQFVHYRVLTNCFVYRFCQPIWDAFLDAAVAGGLIDVSGINEDTLYNVSHSAPPMPWIDPEKEVQAAILAEENGYTSRSRIIRQRGDNPDQINQEIVRDKNERERLGIETKREMDAAAAETAAAQQADATQDAADQEAEAAEAQARAQVKAFEVLGGKLAEGLKGMPPAKVEVAAPVVNVAPAAVSVPAPVVNVAPAAVTVDVPAPVVNVAPSPITVKVPAPKKTRKRIERDANGRPAFLIEEPEE